MKTYRYILALFAAGAFLPAAAQEQTDSTEFNSTVLEEVVIEGRTKMITSEGVSFIPSKEDKKFSYDAFSLLNMLQIPYLEVGNGNVTTVTGEGVSLYIDFKPATQSEVLSLRTKDVLRVEYMEHPSDPRFKGSRNVINFIMQQYEWGGYTSLTALQHFTLPEGAYQLASKYKNKRTTFDLYAKGNFATDPRISSTEAESFNDIIFNQTRYDRIEKMSESHGHSKSRGFSADFLVTSNLNEAGSDYMIHEASIVYSRNPGSWINSSIKYSPDLTTDSEASSISDGIGVSPKLNGIYSWVRGNNSYQFNWSGSYTFNKSNNLYSEKNFSEIINNNREKVATGTATFSYTHTFSDGGLLTVSPLFTADWYFTDYSGNYSAHQRLFKTEDLLLASYYKQVSKVSFYAFGGVSFSSWKVNHENSETNWNPRFNANVIWTPNMNHRISVSGAWGNSSPNSSLSNDAIIQTDPLKWIQGNPYLKITDMTQAILSYLFMPNSKFYMYAWYQLDAYFKIPQYNWIPAPDGLNGIIRTLNPDGKLWKQNVAIEAHYTPINSLKFVGRVVYFRDQYKGITNPSVNSILYYFNAIYYYKNFSFQASLRSSYKELDYMGFGINKTPMNYYLNITYAVNDFQMGLFASNFFSKRRGTTSYGNSPYYSYNMDSFQTGAKVALRLSYTFSYGKKVERTQNNIDETIKSAVLK